jgi:hypothetical protein
MEVTMNRLALFNMQNPGKVAGLGVNNSGFSIIPNVSASNSPSTNNQNLGNQTSGQNY